MMVMMKRTHSVHCTVDRAPIVCTCSTSCVPRLIIDQIFFVPGRALHYNTIVDTASMMARQNQAEGRQVVGAQGVRDVII